ncbi:expansin family protein [Moniliophthora roreri MCA 2997]|uniref:Expansin family protein n=1 Tax=Moniliophthora roreri (strain MCA 2997) TaxID=1381753 RepID=V2X7Z4_MONRO|nr:expansin family protein [Moniliophthora roreri MCA 2997]
MRSLPILSLLVSVLSPASAGHARIQAVHKGHREVKRHTQEKIPPPEKRQGNVSRFTYYHTGLGACGGYNSPNDLIVALNEYQWDNGAHCNQQITININGHTETATVADLCPFDSCPPGALDFSRGLFSKWSNDPEGQGVMYGDWWFGGGPQQPPTTHQEPTTTTEPPPPPTTTSTTSPPPPTSTTSTTPSPPPPTTTSSEPMPSSTSSTPASTPTESSPTSTSDSAPTSSSAPAPTGVIPDAQQVFVGFGAFLTAALSIPV